MADHCQRKADEMAERERQDRLANLSHKAMRTWSVLDVVQWLQDACHLPDSTLTEVTELEIDGRLLMGLNQQGLALIRGLNGAKKVEQRLHIIEKRDRCIQEFQVDTPVTLCDDM